MRQCMPIEGVWLYERELSGTDVLAESLTYPPLVAPQYFTKAEIDAVSGQDSSKKMPKAVASTPRVGPAVPR
jgi:hypothetical protein